MRRSVIGFLSPVLVLLVGGLSASGCKEHADKRCLQLNLLKGEARRPSNIVLFLSVETCDGEPVPGLVAEDFVIEEEGQPISAQETYQTIAPRSRGFDLFTLLLLDMSGSSIRSGNLPELQEAARQFADLVAAEQRIAISLFDGREDLQLLVPFTPESGTLRSGIDSLTGWDIVDEFTNLNGVVVQGLAALEDEAASSDAPIQAGSLVTFTDGTDRAGYVSNGQAQAAVASSSHSSFILGLGGEVDQEHLRALGRDKAVFVETLGDIGSAFDEIAERIKAESGKFYVLGYCSPKRAGSHNLRLSVRNATGELTRSFDATGFSPCDPADILGSQAEPDGGMKLDAGVEPIPDLNVVPDY